MVIVRDTEGVSNKNKTKTVYVARKTMNVFIFLNDKYNIVWDVIVFLEDLLMY